MTIFIITQTANFVKKIYCCNKQVHEAEKTQKEIESETFLCLIGISKNRCEKQKWAGCASF